MDFSHKMQISCLKLEPSQNEKRGREILHRLACIQISFIFQCNSLGLAARRRTFHTKMKTTLWRTYGGSFCKYQIMDSDVFNDRLHRYWRLLRRQRRQLANLARCTIFFRLFRRKLCIIKLWNYRENCSLCSRQPSIYTKVACVLCIYLSIMDLLSRADSLVSSMIGRRTWWFSACENGPFLHKEMIILRLFTVTTAPLDRVNY